jgi:uncharacterized protein YqhQ
MASEEQQRLRLGGMALRNGLLIHGPTHWAAAVRAPDGSVEVASEAKPRLAPNLAARAPGLRGPLKLAEALAVLPLVRRRMPAARLPFEDRRVVAAIGSTLLATAALRKRFGSSALREGVVQAIGALPAVVALLDRDLAAYHGVEHKAIAAYEHGDQDAADAAKEHDRCGSHLMAPLLAANVAGAALLKKVVERPRPVHGAALSLASVGLAVEVFAWSERHSASRTAKALRLPGHELQRVLGTREPTAEQLEVGRAALGEILRAEGCS